MLISPLITADGSWTLLREDLDETYHSRHGALQESLHVFIQYGLQQIRSKEVRLLEVGFGTGLNALLTLAESMASDYNVYYHGIETIPLGVDQIWKIHAIRDLQERIPQTLIQELHTSTWDEETELTSNFTLKKSNNSIEGISLEDNTYNLVYFDAFAPGSQPELWTEEIFKKIYNSMRQDGVLTTYCAKGTVKRALKAAGFSISNPPGPPGKREMTLAKKVL